MNKLPQQVSPNSYKDVYSFHNNQFLQTNSQLIDSCSKLSGINNTTGLTIKQNNIHISEQIRRAKIEIKSQSVPYMQPVSTIKKTDFLNDLLKQKRLKELMKDKLNQQRKFQKIKIGKVRDDVSHFYDQNKCQTQSMIRNKTIGDFRSGQNFSQIPGSSHQSQSEQQLTLVDMNDLPLPPQVHSSKFKTSQADVPASRVQSIRLKQWFESQKVDDCLPTVAIAIKELAKQVKIDCFERGQLVEEIWDKIQLMIQQLRFKADVQMQIKEIGSIDEFNRIHYLYQDQLAALTATSEEAKNQLRIEQANNNTIKKELKEIEEQFKKNRHQLNDYRKLSTYFKKKLDQANYEIELLHRKLENSRNKQGNGDTLIKPPEPRQRQSIVVTHNTLPKNSDSEDEADLLDGLLEDKNIVEMDNMVMNMDKVIKVACVEQQIDEDFRMFITREKETQTFIELMQPEYSKMFVSQIKVDQAMEWFNTRNRVQESLKLVDDKMQQRQLNQIIEQKFMCRVDPLTVMEQKEVLSPHNSQISNNNEFYDFDGDSIQMPSEKVIEQVPHISITNLDSLMPQPPKLFEKQLDKSFLNSSYQYQEQASFSQKQGDVEKIKTLITLLQQTESLNLKYQEQIENMKEQCKVHSAQLEEVKRRSVSQFQQNQIKMLKEEKKDEIHQIEEFLEDFESQVPKGLQSKRRIQIRKPGQKQFKGPQLGQKVNIVYDFQKQNAGPIIVEKVKAKQIPKIKHFMPLKLLIKQISVIYQDRIMQQKENSQVKDQDMASFVYSYFLNQFGIKKIAEQKFLILVLSVKHQKNIVRVNVFARFLGLFDQYVNYSIDEMKKYLEAYDFVNNISQLGQAIGDQDSESRYMIPHLRAVAYIGYFADSRMTAEEKEELKKELELLKEVDPKSATKQLIIDFDQFMIQMFVKYKILVSRAKEYVINAFAACDLDGNGMCNFDEWDLLLRHIEPDRLDIDQVSEIFFTNADLIVKGEQNFSFEKFAVVCVEYGLFSEESQNQFIGIKGTKPEIMIQFQKVVESWGTTRKQVEDRLDQMTMLETEKIDNWREIIDSLENKILEANLHVTQSGIDKKVKPLLIAHILLEQETQLLLEMQQDNESQPSPLNRSIKLVADTIDKDEMTGVNQ